MRRALWWAVVILALGVGGCGLRPGRPAGPLVTGPEAQRRYLAWARTLRFPKNFVARGVFEARSRRGEVTGRLTLTVTDTGVAVLATGPLRFPLVDLRGTWRDLATLVPETTALGVLWRWFRDPLRYPAEGLLSGITGRTWFLATPAGTLRLIFIDTRTGHLYISPRRRQEHRLMLDHMQTIRGFLWPFHWKYQGPKGTVEVTWTRMDVSD